jgi:hypothetical protein
MIRRIRLLGVLAAGLAVGCSGSGSGSKTPGIDAGPGNVDAGQPFTITISGTTHIHPVATALYNAGLLPGTPPALPGTTLRIDEPLLVILMDPQARQGQTIIDDAGNFSVSGVDPSVVDVGLVATIVAGSDDGGMAACEAGGTLPAYCSDFATAATAVWETGHPMADIANSYAWGDPVEFEEFLSTKLAPMTLLQITPGNHLADQGIALGYVVNQGAPVAGAVVDLRGNNTVPQIIYVDDDFSPLGADGGMPGSTNKYGIFIVMHPGEPTQYTYPFGIVGHSEYGCQKIGSSPGSIFNLVFDTANPGMCL